MPKQKVLNNKLELTCVKCLKDKNLDEFHKMKTSKLGYRSICKECRKIDTNQYQLKYKKEISIRRKKIYIKNKTNMRIVGNIRNRKYYQKHKKRILKNTILYIKAKLKTDINFKLKHYLRTRLRGALKNNWKKGSAVRDLGCSIEKFKLWLEMNWQEGMSWDNQGDWHIDHIMPLASFNLQDRKELLKAVHFSNLQPLWAEDNLRKSDKICQK